MLKKFLGIESIQNFFKVRNKEGKLDWEEVKATAVQTVLILITFAILWWIVV